ncbi:MAG: helix-turn-helix domain-containing protein [Kiritimatiellae bacterium]|nr:helix-turn-helix domain-containing protein [Kiritimatiellia bacterium]
MDAKSKLVTISEAAEELGVSRRQVQRLIKAGRLQGAKLGLRAERYRYVTRNSLDAIVL